MTKSHLPKHSISDHLGNEVVDELSSTTLGTEALRELVSLELESTVGRGKLEWPEEVVGLLELGSAGNNLVDEVLDAVDSVLTEFASDDGVVGKRKSGSVDLTVASLVNKLGDGLSGWVAPGDEWLDNSDHVHGSLVELDEGGVVQLSESEQLQDLLGLGSQLVDTSNSNEESNLWFSLNEESTLLLSVSLGLDEGGISSLILLVVLLGVSKSGLSGLSSSLLGILTSLLLGLKQLGISGLFLQDVLWNGSTKQ